MKKMQVKFYAFAKRRNKKRHIVPDESGELELGDVGSPCSVMAKVLDESLNSSCVITLTFGLISLGKV